MTSGDPAAVLVGHDEKQVRRFHAGIPVNAAAAPSVTCPRASGPAEFVHWRIRHRLRFLGDGILTRRLYNDK
jgi:hypothetical protein